MQRLHEAQAGELNPVLALILSWPKQLTYPIRRCSVPVRLAHPKERNRFLNALISEVGLRGACRKMGMHHDSVYRYMAVNKDFAEEVAAIRKFIPVILEEEAREIADSATNETCQVARLRSDVRIRTAAMHAKHQTVEVNVDNRQLTVEVKDPERARLIEMRRKALENKDLESKQSTN